jgi:hypothetical protein
MVSEGQLFDCVKIKISKKPRSGADLRLGMRIHKKSD